MELFDIKTGENYCSYVAHDRAGQIALYNALSNPENKLGSMINNELSMKDISIEWLELPNREGEMHTVPRVIIFDDKGKTYVATSIGIFTAIQRIAKIIGSPTWEEPVKVRVIQVDSKGNKVLTLKMV